MNAGVFEPVRDTLCVRMTNDGSTHLDSLRDAQACIVWHPASREPSPELLRALSKKGMILIDATDAHTAFAAADRVSKTARRTVVVLDTQDELLEADRVIGSLERFTPSVLCWGFEPGANPPLVPIVQPAPADAQPPKPTASGQALSSAPAPLRLVGQDQEAAPAPKAIPTPPPGRALTASDVLDAEELDALLAGEMGDRPQ